MEIYDSTQDTKAHIEKVKDLLDLFIEQIFVRGLHHDESKLESPEKEMYDKYTPLLSSVAYGSDEYKKYLSEMGEALQHHYENNRHHPEHFEYGIFDMNLLDLIEMFCDWKAASLRVKDGDLRDSIRYNQTRFKFGNELLDIFINTADELNW
jgi:hypothetical protein